ncbi:MAG: hypothetical protein K0R17_3607 [Rariglobus sp.]|jgi:hypothetical protein|nr:hypothetical protein [Rariglobus sp.]
MKLSESQKRRSAQRANKKTPTIVTNWIIADIKANIEAESEYPQAVTRAIILNDLKEVIKLQDCTYTLREVQEAVVYLNCRVPCGIITRWRERLQPTFQTIEWHYIADQLPDEEVTVLVAFNASGQPAGAFLQDGVWRYDNGGDEIRSVYAWADFPAIPPAKPRKGGNE